MFSNQVLEATLAEMNAIAALSAATDNGWALWRLAAELVGDTAEPSWPPALPIPATLATLAAQPAMSSGTKVSGSGHPGAADRLRACRPGRAPPHRTAHLSTLVGRAIGAACPRRMMKRSNVTARKAAGNYTAGTPRHGRRWRLPWRRRR